MPRPLDQSSETEPLLAYTEAEGRSDEADGFPKDRWEAMQHIEDIRRGKEKYRGDRMVQGLLKQTQEHNSTTHRFLYELLQNADDNDYGNQVPRLFIRYQHGYLLIESNEIGFNKANVESICSAAQSSKNRDHTRQSVGEKGIGFKSVFMVSTSVWISSGHYSFRFDRDGDLGWILPHWDDQFPVQRTKTFTSILLRIDGSQQPRKDMSKATMSATVVSDLSKLEAMDLMFLSKLKHVEIEVLDQNSWTSWITGTNDQKLTLSAHLLPRDHGRLLDTMVSRDGVVEPLVAFRYNNTSLPSRRAGLHSGLVLVFCKDIPLDRPIMTRKMYAFLPIRDYGFKFVIHADFMLVASRESIIQDSWNDRIIEHIPKAMVQAVALFREKYPELWYRWPLLLPLDGMRDDIFLPISQRTKDVFLQHSIVEDVHGNVFRPHKINHVPDKFRDAQKNPLLPSRCTRYKLLSEKYPAEAVNFLRRLGVPTLPDDLFLSDLAHFINSFATEFHSKSESWHENICKILLDLLPNYRRAIEDLDIIPLQNTRWVSAKFGFLYFGAHTGVPALPQSIGNVGEIAWQIEKFSERGKLFVALGATDAKKSTLCELILREHRYPSLSFFQLNAREMVAHFEFLYHADWTPEADAVPDLWCCISNEEKRQVSQVYMESSLHYSASSVSVQLKSKLYFMHSLYHDTFSALQDGLQWLERTVKVRTLLRVAGYRVLRGLRLHGDFESLLAERPLEALDLLRYHWPFYSTWFRPPEGYRPSSKLQQDAPRSLDFGTREILRRKVSETRVPCHGGHFARLEETYLAKESLLLLCKDIPIKPCPNDTASSLCKICDFFRAQLGLARRSSVQAMVPADRLLEVSNPERGDWDFLQTFGVITKPGAALYIDILCRIRGHPVEYKYMEHLYAQLERFSYGADGDRIRAVFREKDSIYVPDLSGRGNGAWYNFAAVVWDGPSCLRHVPRLNTFYGHRSQIFHKVLSKPIADLDTLKTEAEHLIPTEINHIADVLNSISDYLGMQSGRYISDIAGLLSCPMFPVHPAGADDSRIVLKSVLEFWLIPDHLQFQTAFFGIVDLSVFSAVDFRLCHVLSERLQLASKHISRHVKGSQSDPIGETEREDYAALLRGKVSYIERLIPSKLTPQQVAEKLRLLRAIKVFQSDRIETRWTLKVGDIEISSNAVHGQIISRIEKGVFKIYIVDEDDLLSIKYTPMELSDELVSFCHIEDQQDCRLLTKILGESNPAHIEADFKYRARARASKSPISKAVAPQNTNNQTPQIATRLDANDNPDGRQDAPKEATSKTSDEGAIGHSTIERPKTNMAGVENKAGVQPQPVHESSKSASNNDWKLEEAAENSTQTMPVDTMESSATESDEDYMDKPTGQPLLSAPLSKSENIAAEDVSAEHVVQGKVLPQHSEDSAALQEPLIPKVQVGGVDKEGSTDGEKTENQDIQSRVDNADDLSLRAVDPKIQKQEVPKDPTSFMLKQQSKDDSLMLPLGRRDRTVSLATTRETRSRSAIRTTDATAHDPEWEILPGLDSGDTDAYRLPVKSPVGDGFTSMSLGRFMNPSPRMVFLQESTKDIQYFGELYVARYLSWFLGRKVERNCDKLDKSALNDEESPLSTFSIKDDNNQLRRLLLQQGTIDEAQIDNSCMFYLDVLPTNQGANFPFSLSQELYKKARRLTLRGHTTSNNIYILVRVYKVLSDPGITFYADPWALYLDGLITLEPTGSYHGVISASAPVMLQEVSISANLSAEAVGVYKGLAVDQNKIRLLQLELTNEKDDDLLKAKLVLGALDENLRFWAISYCWGGKPGKGPPYLEINGVQISVTKSLSACLHCLRRRKVEALIWADAVCINQEDDVEKAMQVRRMGSLYGLADQVVIWLGEPSEQDCDAMPTLETLHNQSVEPGRLLYGTINQDLQAGMHVNALLQRAWFTRAWVIQELVFGSQVTVCCGRAELPWDGFIDGVTKCEAHLNHIAGLPYSNSLTNIEPALALDRTRKYYRSKDYQENPTRLKYSFLKLLEFFFYTQSSRDRDKLFALLNLAWDTTPNLENFQPDYQSHEDFILAKYASQLVKSGNALELMYRAGRDKGAQFCSWIPDLMNQRRRIRYASTLSTWNSAGINSKPGFCAGTWLPNDAKVESTILPSNHLEAPKPPVLAIRGIMFDSIHSRCSLGLNGNIQFSNVLTNFRQFLAPLRMYPGCGPDWMTELLASCLIGDAIGPQTEAAPLTFPSAPSAPLPNSERWPHRYKEIVVDVRPDQDANVFLGKPAQSRRIIEQFWQTSSVFMQHIPEAAAGITVKGYAGIIPGEALPGDRIFIPHDSKIPFVLRKKPDSEYYELIGECYIHSIMYRDGRTPVGVKDEVVRLV